PRQGDRLDLQQLGKRRLVDALLAGEIGEQLPLRTGQAQLGAARPLLESLAQQPRHVVQDEAERAAGHLVDHSLSHPRANYHKICYYMIASSVGPAAFRTPVSARLGSRLPGRR